MKKGILRKSLLFGLLPLIATACTDSSTMSELFTEDSMQPGMLGLSISTPSKGTVAVRSIPAEPDEALINSVNVFIFKMNDDVTDETDDGAYYHVLTKRFKASELTDGTEGKKIAWIPIKSSEDGNTYDLSGKKVRIVIIANDAENIVPTEDTSLDGFRTAPASPDVYDGDAADVLVEDQALEGDNKKSFPMSAVVTSATKGGTDRNITVNAKGMNVEATLVRTMARVDIFNYTPNLTVESVSVSNACNSSYLLPSADGLNVPPTATLIGLRQIEEYGNGIALDGHAYKTPEDILNPTKDDVAKLNTRRALYLYEQAVTDEASSPVVTIKYKVKYGETESYGFVNVPFRTIAEDNTEQYVNVERNHVYTIQIGDGNEVNTSSIVAKMTVSDYTYDPADDINQTVDAHN